jgi:hypothetical protein
VRLTLCFKDLKCPKHRSEGLFRFYTRASHTKTIRGYHIRIWNYTRASHTKNVRGYHIRFAFNLLFISLWSFAIFQFIRGHHIRKMYAGITYGSGNIRGHHIRKSYAGITYEISKSYAGITYRPPISGENFRSWFELRTRKV